MVCPTAASPRGRLTHPRPRPPGAVGGGESEGSAICAARYRWYFDHAAGEGEDMARDQVRFVVAVAATLVLVTVAYHLTVTVRAQRHSEQRLKKLAVGVFPEADQRIQNFSRVKMRDGKKVWEIVARQARYSEDTGEVVVDV